MNCKCRKRIIDKLVEKYVKDIDGNEMIYNMNLYDFGLNDFCGINFLGMKFLIWDQPSYNCCKFLAVISLSAALYKNIVLQ